LAIIEQRCRAGVVADLASGDKEAQGAPVRIGDGVELGVHAAFGAPDQAAEIPFLTRRLEAVRCAFKYVASIITVLPSRQHGFRELFNIPEIRSHWECLGRLAGRRQAG
jgi:hypothetical protein